MQPTEGLEPAAYLPASLTSFDQPLPVHDQAAMARLDIDLFAAALRYARDASGGLFDPRKLSRYHDVTPAPVAADEAARCLAWSPYPADYLKSLHPTHPAYAAMKKALAELRAKHGAGAVSLIPDGGLVKAGASDPRIPAVRQKLIERGYADAALAARCRSPAARQGTVGAAPPVPEGLAHQGDGRAGPADRGRAQRRSHARSDEAKLVNNMERLRWLPRELGARHVFVNQAAFEAEVMENGARSLVDARHRRQAQHPDRRCSTTRWNSSSSIRPGAFRRPSSPRNICPSCAATPAISTASASRW